MKLLKVYSLSCLIISAIAVLPACKAKKAIVQQPAPPAPAPKQTPAPVEEQKPQSSETKAETAAPVEKPDYNFSNIQFEFDSGVLKTGAYQILDNASKEMKKDPSARFLLNGHSSAEGSSEHNMNLSVERANSVKTYLVNSGISADNLIVKGYGESKPVTTNTDEAGRALNRRVEIQKQ